MTSLVTLHPAVQPRTTSKETLAEPQSSISSQVPPLSPVHTLVRVAVSVSQLHGRDADAPPPLLRKRPPTPTTHSSRGCITSFSGLWSSLVRRSEPPEDCAMMFLGCFIKFAGGRCYPALRYHAPTYRSQPTFEGTIFTTRKGGPSEE